MIKSPSDLQFARIDSITMRIIVDSVLQPSWCSKYTLSITGIKIRERVCSAIASLDDNHYHVLGPSINLPATTWWSERSACPNGRTSHDQTSIKSWQKRTTRYKKPNIQFHELKNYQADQKPPFCVEVSHVGDELSPSQILQGGNSNVPDMNLSHRFLNVSNLCPPSFPQTWNKYVVSV